MNTPNGTTERNGEAYLFTYSPRDVTLNPTYSFMNHINLYFWSWHKCMESFEVNPEFNQNGNLHYHGYFIIKDKYKWYHNVLPKMKYNGFIKINIVVDDLFKALDYCRKDRELMIRSIDHKIPFTEEDRIKHIPPPGHSTIEDYLRNATL